MLLTLLATWIGFVCVAFVVDVYSCHIVGWRAAGSICTDLILDALEQAVWACGGARVVIHRSDSGSEYLSIRYSERLADAGMESSVCSRGDLYDNALPETINGLYQAEIIQKHCQCKTVDDVDFATLEWAVGWFNNRRPLTLIGDIPPLEYEAVYYLQGIKSASVL